MKLISSDIYAENFEVLMDLMVYRKMWPNMALFQRCCYSKVIQGANSDYTIICICNNYSIRPSVSSPNMPKQFKPDFITLILEINKNTSTSLLIGFRLLQSVTS